MSFVSHFEVEFGKKLTDGHGNFFAEFTREKVAYKDESLANRIEPLLPDLAAFIDSRNVRIGDYYGSTAPVGFFKVIMVNVNWPLENGTPSVYSVTIKYDPGFAERNSEMLTTLSPKKITAEVYQFLSSFLSEEHPENLVDNDATIALSGVCHSLLCLYGGKDFMTMAIDEGLILGVVMFCDKEGVSVIGTVVGIAMPPGLIPPESATQPLIVH